MNTTNKRFLEAWVSRIFRYLGETDKQHNDPGKAVQIGTQRVELLKKYGVLRWKEINVNVIKGAKSLEPK